MHQRLEILASSKCIVNLFMASIELHHLQQQNVSEQQPNRQTNPFEEEFLSMDELMTLQKDAAQQVGRNAPIRGD
jgi:hypothetical protein